MNDNKHTSSHFGTGLIIGLILGGAAVFFLGTKKGKQLLKVITEEGIDSVSDLTDMLSEQDDETFDEMGEVEAEQMDATPPMTNGHAKKVHHEQEVEKPRSTLRRFFKVKKK